MTVRLYLDEDSMSQALVMALRARGVDVQTTQEAGMLARLHEDHLAFATSQGRVLYSYNVAHFNRLHTEWLKGGRSHAGLILGQQRRFSVGEQVRRLSQLIASRTAEEMIDQLEFLSAWR